MENNKAIGLISFLKKFKKLNKNLLKEALQSPKKQKIIPFHPRHLSREAKTPI